MAASDRACELILEIAGGEAGESIDAYPAPHAPRQVRIRRSQTRRLLGVTLSLEDMGSMLERLHFVQADRDDDSITVTVPSWRADVVEEADLIEEVARLHGYEKIGEGWAFRTTFNAESDPFDTFVEACAAHLCARGHTEILTSSFMEESRVDLVGEWGKGGAATPAVVVRNPLTTNHSRLRTSLLPSVLDVIRRNVDHGVPRLRVFEPGTVFLPKSEETALPEEPLHLLIAHTRPVGKDFWNDIKEAPDLFDIKREVEVMASALRVDLRGRLEYAFEPETGRFEWRHRGEPVICGGILGARMAEAWDLEQPVWYAELDLSALFELREGRAAYRQVPEYPASKRDLSLVTPEGVTYAQIEKSLARQGGRLLESIRVFDVYRGDSVPRGMTAFGVRLTFRSAEGTLTDKEVDGVVEKIVGKLHSELGVTLRS